MNGKLGVIKNGYEQRHALCVAANPGEFTKETYWCPGPSNGVCDIRRQSVHGLEQWVKGPPKVKM